jgi:hypothetical protein
MEPQKLLEQIFELNKRLKALKNRSLNGRFKPFKNI